MSIIESIEPIQNLEFTLQYEKKNSGKSYNSNSTAKTSDNDMDNNEIKNNFQQKKRVSFSKPVYTIIDVESYKKLNEDISETRFYYTPEKKIIKKKRMNCGCDIF